MSTMLSVIIIHTKPFKLPCLQTERMTHIQTLPKPQPPWKGNIPNQNNKRETKTRNYILETK